MPGSVLYLLSRLCPLAHSEYLDYFVKIFIEFLKIDVIIFKSSLINDRKFSMKYKS